jgi:hypothetical protein
MRCFFNLHNTDDTILDEEGVEVSNVEELRAQVAKEVNEVRSADPLVAGEWKGWRLEATDPSGAVLFSVNLDPLAR